MIQELKNLIKGKVVIVGIGNELKGDDGVGPELIKRLKGRTQAILMDTGEVPESYTDKIKGASPNTILIIDAVDFGGIPGSVGIFRPGDVTSQTLGTHKINLNVLAKYLQPQTQADIILIGIQPKTVKFGAKISQELEETLEVLEDILISACG